MNNKQLLETSITDLSKTEINDTIILAKNLIEYVCKTLPAEKKERFLNSYGVSELYVK